VEKEVHRAQYQIESSMKKTGIRFLERKTRMIKMKKAEMIKEEIANAIIVIDLFIIVQILVHLGWRMF
jgi:hypothetical protein